MRFIAAVMAIGALGRLRPTQPRPIPASKVDDKGYVDSRGDGDVWVNAQL
jgi:hypothetical protein